MAHFLPVSAASRFLNLGLSDIFPTEALPAAFKSAGFDAMDFDLETVPAMGEEWQRICDLTAERASLYSVALPFGHLPFKKIMNGGVEDKEQFMKNMLLAIEAGGRMGIRYGVIHPKNGPDYETYFKKNVEYLEPLAEAAARVGMTLAIENMRSPEEALGKHRFGSTAEEILALAEHLDATNCWDFGHAHTSGVPQGDSLRLLGKRLSCLHINDNHAGLDEHLMPYFGTIDWNEAMEGLADAGYKGAMNFECKMLRLPVSCRLTAARHAVAEAETLMDIMQNRKNSL